MTAMCDSRLMLTICSEIVALFWTIICAKSREGYNNSSSAAFSCMCLLTYICLTCSGANMDKKVKLILDCSLMVNPDIAFK